MYSFHEEALAGQEDLLSGHLREISVQGLTQPLAHLLQNQTPPWESDTYAEVVADLSWLLDEIRFSGALADLLIRDQVLSAKDAPAEGPASPAIPPGMPIEVIALLHPYFATLPYPSVLFEAPHSDMTGSRVLSLWFAGQMIDSALFRLVAALDRLATALWCLSGKALARRKKDNKVLHPAFVATDLAKVPKSFDAEAWQQLTSLLQHPLYQVVKDMRNGFTHNHRWYSGLHGFDQVVYGTSGPKEAFRQVRAMDGSTHLAVLLGTYDLVLRPAVELASACVGSFVAKALAG